MIRITIIVQNQKFRQCRKSQAPNYLKGRKIFTSTICKVGPRNRPFFDAGPDVLNVISRSAVDHAEVIPEEAHHEQIRVEDFSVGFREGRFEQAEERSAGGEKQVGTGKGDRKEPQEKFPGAEGRINFYGKLDRGKR